MTYWLFSRTGTIATTVAIVPVINNLLMELSMSGRDNGKVPEPKKGQPPGGRAERVIAAVHAATLQLMDERGYDGMEIPEIAERAQVNKTSIYRRWPSKLELVLDVALSRIGLAVPIADTGSLQGDLIALLSSIRTILSTTFAKGLLRALITHDEQEDSLRKARAQFWNTRFEAAGKMVERAIERGELPKNTTARHLLELAAAPLFYRTLVTGEAITGADIKRYADQACRAYGRKSSER
jgi:AcrR family transcriptional regulator